MFFSREAEQDLSDSMEQLADVTLQNQALESSKRKLESELQTLHVGFVMMGFLTGLIIALGRHRRDDGGDPTCRRASQEDDDRHGQTCRHSVNQLRMEVNLGNCR